MSIKTSRLKLLSCGCPLNLLLSLTLLLQACDIQPVATGIWSVEIESAGGPSTETWTVSADRQLTMVSGTGSAQVPVELVGSRMLWNLGEGDEDSSNFIGTVNGNRFSGTLYTQQGNFTVRGRRQE